MIPFCFLILLVCLCNNFYYLDFILDFLKLIACLLRNNIPSNCSFLAVKDGPDVEFFIHGISTKFIQLDQFFLSMFKKIWKLLLHDKAIHYNHGRNCSYYIFQSLLQLTTFSQPDDPLPFCPS